MVVATTAGNCPTGPLMVVAADTLKEVHNLEPASATFKVTSFTEAAKTIVAVQDRATNTMAHLLQVCHLPISPSQRATAAAQLTMAKQPQRPSPLDYTDYTNNQAAPQSPTHSYSHHSD